MVGIVLVDTTGVHACKNSHVKRNGGAALQQSLVLKYKVTLLQKNYASRDGGARMHDSRGKARRRRHTAASQVLVM